ncbi:hypothetical protein FOCC_FOCC016809 [Frankliniella occidentalis]|uniref:Uncharacterized protein LOC113214161 n=1 Tax=Frankliniella occidentalis TaxID=133901 RepID=A0A9C6X9J2_FRAOC|nr:uncharacterized protein LOC113214161 [Frankliniella occidentalis]KAE8737722.1 hypothetical protein FOCC_FOCC016809 [Frankliniella occidentalis]
MERTQKRAASAPLSSAQPPQKAARSSSGADKSLWCTQCWRLPVDKCFGDKHRLLTLLDAKREARKAVADAHKAWKDHQERLGAVEAAVETASEPIALQVHVPRVEGSVDDAELGGGLMMIIMAVEGTLTDEERKDVIDAFMDHAMVFSASINEEEDEDEVAVRANLDLSCMASVLQKLPLCWDGEDLPARTVLLYPNEDPEDWNLMVYDKALRAGKDHVRGEVRVFGRVKNGFCLRASKWYGYDDPRSDDDCVVVNLDDVQFVDSC